MGKKCYDSLERGIGVVFLLLKAISCIGHGVTHAYVQI